MTAQTKLDAALHLAGLGFHVFPLAPLSKLPYIDAWQDRATRDPKQIEAWWTDPVLGLSQDLNVGICTTRYENDKALIVVDVDNKEGKKGDEELLKLELDGFEFPATREQRTPTGGRHLIYCAERACRQGASVLGPGLDIRSRGGYIVGAGSGVDRGQYTTTTCAPAAAPRWLVSRLSGATVRDLAPGRTSERGTAGVDAARARLRALDYLAGAPLALEGSGGDSTAYVVAARLKDFGVDEAAALELLLDHWNDRCSPPWSPEDLKTKVANAYRYGTDAPGVAAPERQFPPVDEPAADAHPVLKLNDSYAFVIAGGGHHILWETHDEHGHGKLEHLGVSTFHAKFAAEQITIGKKTQPITEVWMDHKQRRSYDGICFMPGQTTPARFYNLWQGFSVDPWPKGEPPPDPAQEAVQAFLEHARENVCQGNEVLVKWLMGYFAHIVQRPWEKPLVALVFRGGKGTGKNALIERIGHLLGGHFLLTSNRRYLVGNFNGHLERLLMLALDEAFWSGDKQAEGTLKDLITGKNHVIEHKGKEPYTVDNRTRVAIIGNEDWIVPATHDERRFAVFDVGDGRKQDQVFFTQMREGMEGGGYRLLLRYLLDYPLDGIDPNTAPNTRGLLDQKTASLDPFFQWWLDSLTEGRLAGGDVAGWQHSVDTERFRAAFRHYVRDRGIRQRAPEDRAIGRFLRKCAPGLRKVRERRGAELVYVYHLPELDAARREWDAFIGAGTEWEA